MEVYEANLWDILNEKFPLHANGSVFAFIQAQAAPSCLPETTVTDYARTATAMAISLICVALVA